MDYSTVKETAQRWGVSVRTVNMYLNAGRVPGAVRKEHGWLVPADAQKPVDRRRKQGEAPPARVVKRFMPILSMSLGERGLCRGRGAAGR